MRFDIVTIFPDFFTGFLENGILRRALSEGLVEICAHDLREFTHDRHRTVDDRPFGGGEGMVLKPEPLAEAFAAMGIPPKAARAGQHGSESAGMQNSEAASQQDSESAGMQNSEAAGQRDSESAGMQDSEAAGQQGSESAGQHGSESASQQGNDPGRTRVILMSAQGRPFTQAIARELAALDRVVLVCGRYEGVDERINELYCDEEISIGDYVLSGGELAAAVLIDAAMRLIPGVLGNQASSEYESFGVADAEIDSDVEGVPRSQHGAGGLLDYPHYTRPAEFAGMKTPEVLLNGDHLQIRKWRRAQQLRKTLTNRPDLLEKASLSKADLKLLEEIRRELPV